MQRGDLKSITNSLLYLILELVTDFNSPHCKLKPPSSRYLSTIYSNIVIADININTAPALGPAAADPEDTTANSYRHIRVIVK